MNTPYVGVSDIPNCTNPRDFTCKLMRSMVRSGVYTDYIQNRIVQAQYYRDPNNEKGNKSKPYHLFCICIGLTSKNKNSLLGKESIFTRSKQ